MSDIRITVDATRLHQAIQQMAKLVSAVELKEIIDYETAKVIEAATRHTTSATKRGITASFQQWDMAPRMLPYKPDAWFTLPNGDKRQRRWRQTDKDWIEYKLHRIRREEETKRRAGLARQGWTQIADEFLHIPIAGAAVNSARLASVNGRKIRQESVGSRGNEGTDKYYIMINYRNPVGRWAHAQRALAKAINGRVGYFHNNVRRGVFRSVENVAKRYPGLIVT